MPLMKRFDIREAARCLAVAPSTLRYWEQQGLVEAGRNTSNDYREYSAHNLIDASEIAFYRRLGVPIKELKDYRTLSIEDIDGTLARTEKTIDAHLKELVEMKERLDQQRKLNAIARTREAEPFEPEPLEPIRLAPIDYTDPAIWQILAEEPWRYAVVIYAGTPLTIHEAIEDDEGRFPEALWDRRDNSDFTEQGFRCLLKVDPTSDASNALALFDRVRQQGAIPRGIFGDYLLSAVDEHDGMRWDYYRAWVAIAGEGEKSPA